MEVGVRNRIEDMMNNPSDKVCYLAFSCKLTQSEECRCGNGGMSLTRKKLSRRVNVSKDLRHAFNIVRESERSC